MSTQALKRNPSSRLQPTPRTPRRDQPEPMSLRTDLYLIAHDPDTGRPHLDKEAIAVGLAGAVLLELGHAGRVHLGSRQTSRHGTQQHTTSGNITLLDVSATGDAINDAALTLLWRMGGTVDTHRFIHEFATTSLYEQVRDHLVATGILHTVTRRRYWFIRIRTRQPANAGHTVRARMRIRDVARLYRPRPQDIALAALVTALGLTRYLYLPDTSVTGVFLRLAELVGPEHPLRDVTSVIRPHRIRYQ
ncbi:MAG TPA: GPP34 family phosphoprotein [Micromonosporaceae bacterium]